MRELKASLCYGNDSPGVMSPTPKPFEAVYPPTDLSEVVASLRRELSSMDKMVEEQAAEIAALREAVRMVLDYEQGIGVFDFSGLSAYERQNAAFDAWLEVRERMVRALEDGR